MKGQTYNIGDRIIAEDRIDGMMLRGRTGTIVSLSSCDIGIEFDEPITLGHDCCGKGKPGHCRYARIYDKLSLIDDSNIITEQTEEINAFLSSYEVRK